MANEKKEVRSAFRKAVFKRDKYRCRFCGAKGKDRQGGNDHVKFHKEESLHLLDSHHIIPRDLMPDGGYIASNGISLCDECHVKAEQYLQKESLELESYSPENLSKLIEK